MIASAWPLNDDRVRVALPGVDAVPGLCPIRPVTAVVCKRDTFVRYDERSDTLLVKESLLTMCPCDRSAREVDTLTAYRRRHVPH